MAKKRKAREPVAKTRTYLKYGFVQKLKVITVPDAGIYWGQVLITSQDTVISADSGLHLIMFYGKSQRQSGTWRGGMGYEPLKN